jgi:hypothetical protein
MQKKARIVPLPCAALSPSPAPKGCALGLALQKVGDKKAKSTPP